MVVFTNMTDEGDINSTFGNTSSYPSTVDIDRNWSPPVVVAASVVCMVAQFVSGISIAVRKKALTALASSGARPAGEGGLGYLKLKLWWFGYFLMAVSQITFGASVAFTSAIVAAPMSVLNIAGSAIGGRLLLKDRIGQLGWLGCVILMCGCATFAVSAPVEIDLATVEEANELYTSINLISFDVVIVIIDIVLVVLTSMYGYKHILILSFIVGSSACLSFWFTKGIGVYFVTGAFHEWLLWAMLACQVFLIFFNSYFSNVSFDIYLASHSAATRYVIFTTLIVACATLIFPIKMNISVKEGFLLVLSFITIVVGLFLLNVGKYVEFDLIALVQGNEKRQQPHSDATSPTSTHAHVNECYSAIGTQ